MFQVHSERAKNLLKAPPHFQAAPNPPLRKFPSDHLDLWAHAQLEGEIVKNLSFAGKVEPVVILLLESMASLLIGKKISLLAELSIRECEAFLRDRNSQPAFENNDPQIEDEIKRFFAWLRFVPNHVDVKEYDFSSEKGPFARLSLVDKVRELKAFLHSPEIVSLYQGREHPELLDVEDLTVYVQAVWSGNMS
jgi:hypothetical protein